MLQDQTFSILFQHGVDSGSDPKTVIPSKATRVENLEFHGTNTLRQRPGHTTFSPTFPSTNASAVRSWGFDNQLVVETEGDDSGLGGSSPGVGMFSFVPPEVGGRRVNNFRPLVRAGASIVGESQGTNILGHDVAYMGDYLVEIHDENLSDPSYPSTLRTAKLTVTKGDAVIYTGVISEGSISSSYIAVMNPRLIAVSSTEVRLFYVRNVAGVRFPIVTRSITISSGTVTLGSPSECITDLTALNRSYANGAFDVVRTPLGQFLWCAPAVTNLNRLAFGLLASDGVSYFASDMTTETVDDAESPSCCIYDDGSALGTGIFAYVSTATGTMETVAVDAETLASLGRHSHGFGTEFGRVSVGTLTTSSGSTVPGALPVVAWEDWLNPGPGFTYDLKYCELDGFAAPTGRYSGTIRGLALAGRPARISNQAPYIPTRLQSSIQATNFLLAIPAAPDVQPVVVARSWSGVTNYSSRDYRLPTTLFGNNAFLVANLVQGTTVLEDNSLNASGATRIVSTLFTLYASLSEAGMTNRKFLAGANPLMYDGARAVEAAFHHYPESSEVTAGTVTGGSLTVSSTYQVVFVYEGYDARGRRYQSAPSIPISFTTGASGTVGATCVVPSLVVSEWFDDYGTALYTGAGPAGARLVPYRTQANGTIFYRDRAFVSGTPTPQYVQVGSGNVTFDLAGSDASLGEILYVPTVGGDSNFLENEPFYPCEISCVHQGRVFLVDALDPYMVRYTVEDDGDPRFSIETNEVYRFRVPAELGRVCALASMDDKLVLIGEKRIGVVFGTGPNRLGLDNQYSPVQFVSANLAGKVGFQRSLVQTPAGLMFMSAAGIRMLSRGMDVAMDQAFGSFYGAVVDPLIEGATAIAAVEIANRTQVRFVSDAGTLLWDYGRQVWGQFPAAGGTSGSYACNVGAYTFIQSGAQLSYANAAVATDRGFAFSMVVETGWITLGQLQGFQRLRELQVLAQCMTTGSTLTMEIGYDYDTAYTESVVFTATAADASQPRLRPARQKCEAFRLRVTVSTGSVEGFRLTGFSARVGMKRGLYKRANSRSGE